MDAFERSRKMAARRKRYEQYFDQTKKLHITEGSSFYAPSSNQTQAPTRQVVTIHERSPTRFDHITTPNWLVSEVRKTFRNILEPNRSFLRHLIEPMKFVAQAAAIFIVLFGVMNFGAISSQVEFLMSSVFATGEHAAFSHFTASYQENQDLGTAMIADERGFYQTIQPASNEDPTKDLLDHITITPPDNRIVIPSIGQNIPIRSVSAKYLIEQDWKALEDAIQDELQEGVVHYPGTAEPGEIGNVFITGHSSYYLWDPGKYKDVFALLHHVNEGEFITVFYNQEEYVYKVIEKKVVAPDNVDVLAQGNKKQLTLMTCTPIGTAINRLILVAEEVTDSRL